MRLRMLILLSLVICVVAQDDDEDFAEQDISKVSCGSAIKLEHMKTGYRLHSHEVQYGSGSHQQSVTCISSTDDPNSLWAIRAGYGRGYCEQGKILVNGDEISLQHLATKKFLHSHLHTSPLSGQQEVSAFLENRRGDTGDTWIVVIAGGGEWTRGTEVYLKHKDTGLWLTSSSRFRYGNPIPGQQEVACSKKKDKSGLWRSAEGWYFPERKQTK